MIWFVLVVAVFALCVLTASRPEVPAVEPRHGEWCQCRVCARWRELAMQEFGMDPRGPRGALGHAADCGCHRCRTTITEIDAEHRG